MFKITWNIESDHHKRCFAVCNYESAFSLWWNLTRGGSSDGAKAIDVKIWDLSGNEVRSMEDMRVMGDWTRSGY